MADDASVFLRNGFFSMLALDHRDSFKRMIGGEVLDADVIERKKEIIAALGMRPSGILVDMEHGLAALREAESSAPFLLAMEGSGYEGGEERHTRLAHAARDIRGAGARGAKLLLYMRGEERDASQVAVGKRAFLDAESATLPLFLEIVTYGEGPGDAGSKTLAAMALLTAAGVRPAVWKLEAPGSPELCGEITAAANGAPWILLSRGTDFERFAWELKECIAFGAKGFLVGRSLWKEALTLGGQERARFLNETMPERFETLCSVLGDASPGVH